MIATAPKVTRIPLEIAGSSKFGRYPKISAEKTYNMYLSDGWLVPTPGYRKIAEIDPEGEGRDIFTSSRGNFMLVVIDVGVWRIDKEIKKWGRTIPIDGSGEQFAIRVGTLETASGDVSIAENNAEEIAISDMKDIHVYDYRNNTFTKSSIDFKPGFLTFQDGYIIVPDIERNEWRLSDINNAKVYPAIEQRVGEFQTKSNNVKAVVSIPGKGNFIFVMGKTVTESWHDTGYKLFPYFKTAGFNIDYGCLNGATIAQSDKFVIWLGVNEKSAPVIMASSGGPAQQISEDGINFELAQLNNPENAYGFLWKNDGHLFYQLTFPLDNKTYLFDFNTNKFYFLCDQNMDRHIAKRVTLFNGDYYFVSLIDGNIYRLSGNITTYDSNTIPRIRVCNTIRLPDNTPFIARKMGFTIEQGEDIDIARVDMSLSYDGGVSFNTTVGQTLNSLGKRQNMFTKYQLGRTNELTAQFRFWGSGRFVCTNGYVEIYQ